MGLEKMQSRLCCLYLLNAAVLITHEIDSAYWHEWELFNIPGGIQVFLGLNFLLAIVVLYGLLALVTGRSSGIIFSWVLVAGGFFAVVIHAYFILKGIEAFGLPASLVLLVAALILSLAQALALLGARRAA